MAKKKRTKKAAATSGENDPQVPHPLPDLPLPPKPPAVAPESGQSEKQKQQQQQQQQQKGGTAAASASTRPSSAASSPLPQASEPYITRSKYDALRRVARSALKVVPRTEPLTVVSRHWRDISAYHGSWLQISVEMLEVAAVVNYNTMRPRPVDPAVFFDIVKIRKGVDEATDLAVRASCDTVSAPMSSVTSLAGMASLRGAPAPRHGIKMSAERRFRMRELACQKLARAYRLDDIIACITTTQGTSILDGMAGSVLQRNPNDPDAKYAHFFHEKIVSRTLGDAQCFDALRDVIFIESEKPEVLRTIAALKAAKCDMAGAAKDLTRAIALLRHHPEPRRTSDNNLKHEKIGQPGRKNVELSEDQQPTGLEIQLIFQRGSLYLLEACDRVLEALKQLPQPDKESQSNAASDDEKTPKTLPLDFASLDPVVCNELREAKTMAKYALRDFMYFLSQLDYSPNLPLILKRDFNEKMTLVAKGSRNPRSALPNNPVPQYDLYTLADLFSTSPPANIPEYPTQETLDQGKHKQSYGSTCECLTYHPLLSETLHALLFCHCLIQTPVPEIRRHAYMVARLVRLSDGYPLFYSSKSSSRSDWGDVLQKTDGDSWLALGAKWDFLCMPVPIPGLPVPPEPSASAPDRRTASAAAAALVGGNQTATQAQDNADQPSAAQPSPAQARDHCGARKNASGHSRWRCQDPFCPNSGPAGSGAALVTYDEDRHEFAILSDRVIAVSHWIKEVPTIPPLRRNKKRVRKSRPCERDGHCAGKVDGDTAEDLASLNLGTAGDA
ncbi:histidine kinase group protein [Purpureocillium lavendulum]|uniref:Histidine kinase group protein n=1 Tax=Purpureocillium lavendulum TaxID=1247861 RepID=A0AB34G4B1_9HYPO|nr:histidine kinase group protein [Purpureocillium lavendulum]